MPKLRFGWRPLGPRVMSTVVLIGSITAAYAATNAWWPRTHAIHRSDIRQSTSNGAPVNPFESANGTHLVAYFFTASDCGWSKLLSHGNIVKTMSDTLRSLRGGRYADVTVIGVALDKDLQAGLDVLAQLGKGKHSGAFDQLVVGGSWLNDQMIRLGWRDELVSPALPQVFIIERPVDTKDYINTNKIVVNEDRVLATFVGERQITMWKDRGFPVPQTNSTGSAAEPRRDM